MRTVRFGQTGLDVSAVAYGGMSLTAERADEGKAAVAAAWEAGITFYDTADVYGRGEAERILGEALREATIPRDEIVIASKCGIVFPGMVPAYEHKAYDLSPAYLKASCEASLTRLGVEYLDLYQPHRVDYLTHPEETARGLEELIAEGKIRHAGVSNHTADEIRALSQFVRLESLQTQFSLLHLEPLETGLNAVCAEKHMSILCWSPLHKGKLAGGRAFEHGDWQQQREAGVVSQVEAMARDAGVTPGQLSLAWLMQLPGGVIPLVGTASAEHVAEAASAADLALHRDDWYELMVIGRGRPMPWSQRPYLYTKER
jgi:aryl-alcohol dehydrogenase-like predicted oxidoreductase